MLGFIESKNKRKPPPPESNFDPKKIFFFGLLLIVIFSLLLLPFGIFFPISISIWALLLLFLPLLFLGIFFINRFGYVILFSVFIALLDGGISILFLGDFIGYITKTNSISGVEPSQFANLKNYKYAFFRDFKIQMEALGSFQAPITIRARGNSKIYGPLLQFRYAPIVSSNHPNQIFPLYALCYAEINQVCHFSRSLNGGIVLAESIWESNKTQVEGKKPLEGAIFILWKGNGESDIIQKGLSSTSFFLFSILLWAYICFRKKR